MDLGCSVAESPHYEFDTESSSVGDCILCDREGPVRMGCATPGVAPLMQSGILADRRLPPMISVFPFV